MKMLYLSPRKFSAVDIDPKLSTYCNLLDCEAIETLVRKVGNKEFLFIRRRFRSKESTVTAFDEKFEPVITGPLLVGGINEEGDERDLTDAEYSLLAKNMIQIELELASGEYKRYVLRNVRPLH